MHKYHLVLQSDDERDIVADDYFVEAGGSLTFVAAAGSDKLITYAPGTWVYVEQERKDDK